MKKKTYINPVLTLTCVQTEGMMAMSYTDSPASKDGEVLVKENFKSVNYNVWDDDWSKE